LRLAAFGYVWLRREHFRGALGVKVLKTQTDLPDANTYYYSSFFCAVLTEQSMTKKPPSFAMW